MSMNTNEDAVAVGKGAINYGSKNAQSDYEKRKKGTVYRPSKQDTGGNQIKNWFDKLGKDVNREVYNFLGDWSPGGNVWADRPMVSGGGLGDLMEGSRLDAWWPKPEDPGAGIEEPPAADRSMAEILKEIMDTMGGGDGGFGGIRSQLQSQQTTNDARLEAMYRQVADYINGLRPQTEETYTKAAEGYNQAQQSSANAINMSTDIARQQQANMLKALGIEEAANVASARGEDMGNTQTAANARFADILNANLNRNTAAQTGALSGLQNLSTATIGEGARARQAYQEAMSQKLAELAAGEAQYNNQRNDQAMQMAMDAMSQGQTSSATPEDINTLIDNWVLAAKDRGLNNAEAQAEANAKLNAYKAANGLS